MLAVLGEHTEIVKVLLNNYADTAKQSKAGMSASILAEAIGNKEIISLFKK